MIHISQQPESLSVGLEEEQVFPENETLRARMTLAELGWRAPNFYDGIPFFDLIRTGNYEGITKHNPDRSDSNEVSLSSVPLFSDNPSKNMEYAMVASIALSMQAAVEGGLEPVSAYALASTYYRRVERCHTFEQANESNYRMARDFAKAVHREHLAFHQNPIAQQCDRYIMNHLTSPFSVTELAETLDYSTPYLQRIYKEVSGVTLTEMHRMARIRMAMYWLQHTDRSVSSISQQLCFSSQSHFGAVFKQNTGMTPREYRKQVQTIQKEQP